MKQRLRNIIKGLTFRKVMLGLTAIVFILFFLSRALPADLQQRLGLLEGPGMDLGFDEAGLIPSDDSPGLHYIDETNYLYSVNDVLPYRSAEFNVTYIDGTDTFYVNIDPAAGIDENFVYAWFESFADVDDAHTLNIVFVQTRYDNGAPAS